MHKLVRQPS
ncbi:rCG39724 [Rattus norvegicus]|uniref:RCG39724 n=1 Tax=Rattus norvegicus TaxID=10116 RepID=A6I649_RAT|nr:rCG39724 [Rattus norvegicus]